MTSNTPTPLPTHTVEIEPMNDALKAEWRRTSDSQEEGRVTIVWEDDTPNAAVWEVCADMTSAVANHVVELHNASLVPPARAPLPEWVAIIVERARTIVKIAPRHLRSDALVYLADQLSTPPALPQERGHRDMSTTITVKAMVELPILPNFLRYDGGTIPIAEVSDEDLRDIGTAWTLELVKLAQRRRAQAKL